MHCVGRVEKVLSELEGVSEVTVNLEAGEASVEVAEGISDETLTNLEAGEASVEVAEGISDETLTSAVTEAGYPAKMK